MVILIGIVLAMATVEEATLKAICISLKPKAAVGTVEN
jgi:hypothetical protein